jgi:hypothetical protein
MEKPRKPFGVESWGPGSRTPTYGSRNRCPAIRRAPTSEENFIISEYLSQIKSEEYAKICE